MKLAIKLVDAEAIIINIKTKLVISKLSNDPIMSVGFVNILDKFSGFCFKKESTPATINKAKKEKITRFNIRLKFPFFNSFSFLTYLEKSPKVKMTIEKKAKTVPVTVIRGNKLFLSIKFLYSNELKKTSEVNFTSLKRTVKKNNNIPK